MLVLLSSKQIFACDYYENERALEEILDTGTYENVSGKVCSYDKRSVIPIKKGKANGKVKVFIDADKILEVIFKNDKREGLAKDYYESGTLKEEFNYINGKVEGLDKVYYKSGALKAEGNYKDNEKEGLWKEYDESGALEKEEIYQIW